MVIFPQKGWIIKLMDLGQFVSKFTTEALVNAAHALKSGSLVVFPTETVYGLGANASDAKAVERIYEVKGRPTDHPLIVHIGSMQEIDDWVMNIPDFAISLARVFWPGPMTLILNRSLLAQDFITGGQDTVGIRVPNHPIALALLDEFQKLGGKGIAAPSANRFGHVSPTTANAVNTELAKFLTSRDLILDGGPSLVGIESTIIDCTGSLPKILRPGAITEDMITEVTNLSLDIGVGKIRVSGSLEKHYSPNARVILDTEPKAGDGFIALANIKTPQDVIRLAEPRDNEEFARLLYSALRTADERYLSRVIVEQPLGDGIAIAIRDRLMRASRGQ
ncbi:MAG: threonylcarbamoyl-AMP synthase [Actinobacteria bacterium]|nr:threonylcarbamoyl-AMP synthase [Actinomycetota bacterium]MSX57946.1 threonylcarbamoyl-AMP synthase [Actinomycetota bacterium]